MSLSEIKGKELLPTSDGPEEKKFALSPFRFGIDAEIDKALCLFGNDELHLLKKYWPKAFRALISNILQCMLHKNVFWKELSSTNFLVNEEQLRTLIEELKAPNSPHIKVKQRRWIVHLLREVSIFRKKFGIGLQLPKLCVQSTTDWPRDIEDRDDLSSSITVMSLREDVRKFFWNLLDETIPSEKYCNMHYFGAIRSFSHCCPIVIEVPEDLVDKLKDRIVTVSDILRSEHYENYLPVDMVNVKGVPERELKIPVEEGFHTSGSPWKDGTVGGILKYGQKFVGITSGHVHRKKMTEFDDIYTDDEDLLSRFVDESVDVAFFTFADCEEKYNLLPMEYMESNSAVNLEIGEPVYKIGRSTGLTIGKLGSLESTVRFSGSNYVDHVQVIWNEDNCRFAFSKDCGSIYCVRRGAMYIPIGIHRISDSNASYGCSIWKAMEYFPENTEVEEALAFVNPSYLVI